MFCLMCRFALFCVTGASRIASSWQKALIVCFAATYLSEVMEAGELCLFRLQSFNLKTSREEVSRNLLDFENLFFESSFLTIVLHSPDQSIVRQMADKYFIIWNNFLRVSLDDFCDASLMFRIFVMMNGSCLYCGFEIICVTRIGDVAVNTTL